MLPSVSIDAKDSTFDRVLTDASTVVAGRQKTVTSVDHEKSTLVKLSRLTGMCESAAAARVHRVCWMARTPGEGDLGDEVIGPSEIGAPLDHCLYTGSLR